MGRRLAWLGLAWPLTVQVLLEAADLADGAEADLCALVVLEDGDVQGAHARAVAAAGTAGLLNL